MQLSVTLPSLQKPRKSRKLSLIILGITILTKIRLQNFAVAALADYLDIIS